MISIPSCPAGDPYSPMLENPIPTLGHVKVPVFEYRSSNHYWPSFLQDRTDANTLPIAAYIKISVSVCLGILSYLVERQDLDLLISHNAYIIAIGRHTS
jgi:hypothetical protein